MELCGAELWWNSAEGRNCPFGWVIGAEDSEIGLEFLIGSFGLSVGLRMVGSGESDIIVEKMG